MDIEVLGTEEKGTVTKTVQYSESSLVGREIGVSPLLIAVDFDFERWWYEPHDNLSEILGCFPSRRFDNF